MLITKSTLIRAREISANLAQGINPLSENPIENADFMSDAKMIRYFSFITEVLTNTIEGESAKKKDFYILQNEVKGISLSEGDINISAFASAVNDALYLNDRKPLRAAEINRKLKGMGLLKAEIDKKGKTRTRVTENGKEYGIIEEEIKTKDGSYFRINYSEKGKKYLLDNLINILNYAD